MSNSIELNEIKTEALQGILNTCFIARKTADHNGRALIYSCTSELKRRKK